MTYHTEFDADYAIAPIAAALPVEFEDTSWHNNACPSFGFTLSNGESISLYIDHPNPAMRESGTESKRFVVQLLDADSSWPCDGVDDLLTDDLDVALAQMTDLALARLGVTKFAVAKAFCEEVDGATDFDSNEAMHAAISGLIGFDATIACDSEVTANVAQRLWNDGIALAKDCHLSAAEVDACTP